MPLLVLDYDNAVDVSQFIGVGRARSRVADRARKHAKEAGKLIDLTNGRKVRSVIYLATGHLILSAYLPRTITQRMNALGEVEKALNSRPQPLVAQTTTRTTPIPAV